MEEMNYQFSDGSEISVVLGEDGYNVNISGGGYAPKTGVFTTFENMLHGIAPIVQGCELRVDIEMLALHLSMYFPTELDGEEIEKILMEY